MITLYQFPAVWDITSASCFCAKVELFLACNKIDYTLVNTLKLQQSPSGKLPFIRDGATVLSDSDLIISALAQNRNIELYPGCSEADVAISRAIHYLCEEGLYRAMSYFRFVDDAGWRITRNAFFSNVPKVFNGVLDYKVRRYVKRQLDAHGISRKARSAIINDAIINLLALSEILSDKSFFMSDQLTLTDLTVYSVISNYIVAPYEDDISECARSIKNLSTHTDRVRMLCFPEYKVAG